LRKSYYFLAGAVTVVALGSVVVVSLGSVVVVALGSVTVVVSVLVAEESVLPSPAGAFSVLLQEARENTNARTNKRFKNFMVEMF
jgi:hypothetical protein